MKHAIKGDGLACFAIFLSSPTSAATQGTVTSLAIDAPIAEALLVGMVLVAVILAYWLTVATSVGRDCTPSVATLDEMLLDQSLASDAARRREQPRTAIVVPLGKLPVPLQRTRTDRAD